MALKCPSCKGTEVTLIATPKFYGVVTCVYQCNKCSETFSDKCMEKKLPNLNAGGDK